MQEQSINANEKRLFYFQFKESFFSNQETREIFELAIENGDNPNDYITFYLMCIAISLRTDGYILPNKIGEITPNSLRRRTGFKTQSSIKDDIDLVDKIVTSFINESIFYRISDGSLFIPSVENMAMNKKADSERIKNWRLKKRKLDLEVKSQINSKVTLPDFELIELTFIKTFNLLLAYNLAKESEEDQFKEIFITLVNQHGLNLITDAIKLFTKNISFKDTTKIIDSKEYFTNSLVRNVTSIIQNQISENELKKAKEMANYDWVNNND